MVLNRRPRIAPTRPSCRIKRATVHRATRMPSRISCRHTLRTPYTRRFASQTRRISVRNVASRFARGESRLGSPARAVAAWYVDGAIGSIAQIGSTP